MFQWQKLLIFMLVAAIAVTAAAHRFGDSSHAIGLLSIKGGKARHPFHLETGLDRYTLIMTGTVLPPLRGDVRVTLEGKPNMDYTIYNAEPLVSLDIFDKYNFDGSVLRGVRPGERFALWVVMQPKAGQDPGPDPPTLQETALDDPDHGALSLNFYHTATAKKVLHLPVTFADREHGGRHGG